MNNKGEIYYIVPILASCVLILIMGGTYILFTASNNLYNEKQNAMKELGLKDIKYSAGVGLYHGDLNGERKFVTVVCKGISMRQYECDAWFTSIGDYRVVVQ